MKKHTFSFEGHDFSYWTEGDPKNPPLVVLYGYTGEACDFEEIASLVREKVYFIVPQLPGWKKDQKLKEDLALDFYADYVKQLLDRAGIKKAHIFGHCMGVLIALEMVRKYPSFVDKLFLSNPLFIKGTLSEKFFKMAAGLARKSPESLRPSFFFWRNRALNALLDLYVIRLPFVKRLKRIKEQTLRQPLQNEKAVEENWFSFLDFDYGGLREINCPTHIIHGGDDRYISLGQAKKFKALFPNATLDVINRSGHVPLVETPSELVAVILKYL